MPKIRTPLALLLSVMVCAVQAQLPPAPTPVPGSPLDRPGGSGGPGGSSAPMQQERAQRSAAPDPADTRQSRRFAFGTAFRVDAAGHLLTNRHVVENCEAVGIVGSGGVAAVLRVVATDSRHDIALLAGSPDGQPAPLRASDEPLQGEDVLTYGYPLPGMLSSSGQLGAGMVTALTGIRSDPGQLQIDVPLQGGNSGGPLIDRRGQVIGIVFSKLNALRIAQLTGGDLPQNVSFAIRLAPIKKLLDAHGVRYTVAGGDARQLNNQEIAARARQWTVPIVCKRKEA